MYRLTVGKGAMEEGCRQRRQEFIEAVNRLCIVAGGVRIGAAETPLWEIDTVAGKLRVCPMGHSGAPWISCWFLEPKRAAGWVDDFNPLTGCWSFRLWASWDRWGDHNWQPAYSNGLKFFESRLQAILDRTAQTMQSGSAAA